MAVFEKYYAKQYGEKRSWKRDNRGGYTREGLQAVPKPETAVIGEAWDGDSSEVATDYYAYAEKDTSVFWGEKTVFQRCFDQLDCSSIVELACGHGRHVPQYIARADRVTLVDINRSNIEYCKNRFQGNSKIRFLVNSGNNFAGIEDNSQTAVFSYDAMVHFELLDVLEYLKDASRILTDGGKVLFHHSNVDFYPELSGLQKNLWRNFMSADIFAYLATRTGFRVLSQHVVTFGRGKNFYPNTDCVSLCEKIWKL